MTAVRLAFAVAAAVAPAAAIAQPTVEIYGRANVGVDRWRANGATVPSGNFDDRLRIYSSTSRIGLRAHDDLGGGLRAYAVLESGVNLDSGNNSGQSGGINASTGFWTSRDSYLGVGGAWGDVLLGRQTIFRGNGVLAHAMLNHINAAAERLVTGGHGMVLVPAQRVSNVLTYLSPTIGGFNASLSWSPSTTEAAVYTGTGQEKDSVWALSTRYRAGQLFARFDAGRRRNASTTLDSGRTVYSAWKAGLGWAYVPGSQISWVHERIENKNVVPNPLIAQNSIVAGDSPRVRINLINWEHPAGPWWLIAQFAWAGSVTGISGADTSNTRVRALTLAATYSLSKRTAIYVSSNAMTNQANAFADFLNAGMSSASTTGLTALNEGADVHPGHWRHAQLLAA